MLKGNEAVGKKLCHHCVVAMTPGDANKEISKKIKYFEEMGEG